MAKKKSRRVNLLEGPDLHLALDLCRLDVVVRGRHPGHQSADAVGVLLQDLFLGADLGPFLHHQAPVGPAACLGHPRQ